RRHTRFSRDWSSDVCSSDLKIKNPKCVAYDLLFGCPGWLEGFIQAQAYIKAGMAKKCLVIGAETLSRVVDRNDRDSMIYSDGARSEERRVGKECRYRW